MVRALWRRGVSEYHCWGLGKGTEAWRLKMGRVARGWDSLAGDGKLGVACRVRKASEVTLNQHIEDGQSQTEV